MIRFIHISDTHIGTHEDFEVMGIVPYPRAVQLVETLNALEFTPDFIVHTGDVVHEMPDVENTTAYELANKVLGGYTKSVPFYYVTGNHDRSDALRSKMSSGPCEYLTDSLNTYRFDIKGVRFLTIDARGPDEIDPHGVISDEQMKIVKNEVNEGTLPLMIFIHFPPVVLDSPWVDRDMLINNGDELHTLFVQARSRIRGVFFGHVHRPITIYKDGILYASTSAVSAQFFSYPTQEKVSFQTDIGGCFNIVTLSSSSITIKQHSYPYLH